MLKQCNDIRVLSLSEDTWVLHFRFCKNLSSWKSLFLATQCIDFIGIKDAILWYCPKIFFLLCISLRSKNKKQRFLCYPTTYFFWSLYIYYILCIYFWFANYLIEIALCLWSHNIYSNQELTICLINIWHLVQIFIKKLKSASW